MTITALHPIPNPATTKPSNTAAFLRLLHGKWYPPADPTTSFHRKTILVTGSNVGLGFEAVKKYVLLGAQRVILAVRNVEKGTKAKEAVEQHNGQPLQTRIDVWELDMDRFASVTAFAARVDRELERLDVALLNAGVMMRPFRTSPEGWEETIQVNVLSTAFLALRLLPKLRASKSMEGTPHLTVVSSALHAGVKREQLGHEGKLLARCNASENFAGQRQYSISKLFLMYVANELAALAMSPSGEVQVVVTSCCPGFCTSDLGRQYNGWMERNALWLFHGVFARSTEAGARTLVSATVLGPEAHGRWWKNDEFPA